MILVTRVYVRDLPQSRLLVGRRWIHERKYLSRDTKSESEYVSEVASCILALMLLPVLLTPASGAVPLASGATPVALTVRSQA